MEDLEKNNVNTIRILSVDDEPDMQDLLMQKFRRKIRKGDYEFYFANNGQEALEQIEKNPAIDFILCDINMPVMDGLTFLSKLKEQNNPVIKTIMLTAYGDIENIRKSMNNGAFDFLNKPIDFEDLEITMQKTIHQIDEVKKSLIAKRQLSSLQRDLQVAKDIQLSLLPRVFPPFPDRNEFDIYATIDAAKMVGGDFYDFFMLDESRIALVIGDVAGKGIPGAIFMAMSRTIIRTIAMQNPAPDICMAHSNDLISQESIDAMFVTVFYTILDLKTGELIFANAGHCPPYILRNDNSLEKVEKTGDMVLGIIEGLIYKCDKKTLKPGEELFMFTDGVSEAMNPNDELYSEDRLEKLLPRLHSLPVNEINNTVVKSVIEFANGAEQSDDITTLCIRYKG